MMVVSSRAASLSNSHSSFCEFTSLYSNVALPFPDQSIYGVKS